MGSVQALNLGIRSALFLLAKWFLHVDYTSISCLEERAEVMETSEKPPGKLGYNPWPLTAEEASGHYNLMLILCKASFSPSSSVAEKWFVNLCSTLHCDALSGLCHASADLRLVPAPRGLFSHQTCGSAVLREVRAAATWRLPRRGQRCTNVSSNSEELKLSETLCGSYMLAAEPALVWFPGEAVSSHQQNMQQFSQS